MAGKLKFYYLGGHVREEADKKFRNRYIAEVRKIFAQDAGLRRNLQFEAIFECDVKTFKRIWQADDTAGLAWEGHGGYSEDGDRLGYPLALELKDGWQRSEVTLNPIEEKFPKSGRNLISVTFLGCGTGELEDRWRDKITNPKARIKTVAHFLARLRVRSMRHSRVVPDKHDIRNRTLNWIKDSTWERPEDPTVNLRNMLWYAAGTWEEKWVGFSCDCSLGRAAQVSQKRQPQWWQKGEWVIASEPPEKPTQVSVPFKIIPKVAIDAPSYTQHTVRFGDRIWYLAGDYGYRDRRRFVQDVGRLNPGIDFKRLAPGRSINVPTKVGVPTRLSPPYALHQAEVKRRRAVPSPGVSMRPSALELVRRQLERTPKAFRPPTFNTGSTLARMERQALDRQQTQQWLDRVQRQLGPRRNLSGLALAGRQLERTPKAFRPPTFNTGSTLARIEREGLDRQRTQQWLNRVQRQLDRRRNLSALALAGRQLERTPQAFRPPTFNTGSALARMERQALDRQRTQQWLNRVQRQLVRRPAGGFGGRGPFFR